MVAVTYDAARVAAPARQTGEKSQGFFARFMAAIERSQLRRAERDLGTIVIFCRSITTFTAAVWCRVTIIAVRGLVIAEFDCRNGPGSASGAVFVLGLF